MAEQSVDYIRQCYDAVAREYAERFAGELRHKPLDRELLSRLATEVSEDGELCDLGCGPGHTTAFLLSCRGGHGSKSRVCGLDISAENLREATRLHPGVVFEQGDMLALPRAGESVAGVVAFYAIVHFSPAQLQRALMEMYRVLRPGGRLLLSFHAGDGAVHVEEFLGRPMTLEFVLFRPEAIADELAGVGFTKVEVNERDHYPDVEYPSRRAYVFASKAELP